MTLLKQVNKMNFEATCSNKHTLASTFRTICLLGFIGIPFLCNAQNEGGWTKIFPTVGSFSFQMPSTPQKYDTLNTLFYVSTVNSLAFEVHHTSGAVFNTALANPLDLFAQIAVTYTNGELISNSPINVRNGITGREVGILYTGEMDEQMCAFSEVVFYNNQLLTLTITAPYTYLSELLNYKDAFFNSLIISLN